MPSLTNEGGDAKVVKLEVVPKDGEKSLSDDEAQAKGPDFAEAEFKDRLAKGPVAFDFIAILGRDGDPTGDPTLRWEGEDDRPTTALGTIEIDALAPNEKCDAITFLPTNLPDGIAGPSDDLIFPARRHAPAP